MIRLRLESVEISASVEAFTRAAEKLPLLLDGTNQEKALLALLILREMSRNGIDALVGFEAFDLPADEQTD